jgi:hypothetical protein
VFRLPAVTVKPYIGLFKVQLQYLFLPACTVQGLHDVS